MDGQLKDQPKREVRILHLEDSKDDCFFIARALEGGGLACEFVQASSRSEFEAALGHSHFDLILSDFTIPGYSGMEALIAAQKYHPQTPFIFLSGTIGEDAAVESLQHGAVDYLLKNNLSRLVPAVKRALEEAVKHAESLHQQQRLWEQAALLDLARDSIIVTEMGGNVRYWNRGAERLHGWTRDEVLGRSTKDFLYPDLSWFKEAVKVLHAQGEWSGDVNKRTKSGAELLMRTHWTLVHDSSGLPESVLSISTDITAQKELEEQFLRAQRMESIGTLAGGIAHDLNNIFSPILMAAEMLKADLSGPDRKTALNILTSSARRGADMVARILAFARGTGGLKTPLKVDAIFDEMVPLLKSVLPRGIQLQLSIEDGMPLVLGNATQLHQVLMNLCVNARDAMPGGGKLLITAQATHLENYSSRWEPQAMSGHFIAISVSDTGHGILPEILDKIFEPFFSTKSAEKGTGLGLATVRGIVRNHGGFLDLLTTPGEGTTFRVYLPVVKS